MTCKDTLIAKPSQILLPFATVELVEKDKPTLPDKSGLSPCVANSQRQKSSKTTEAASISNEKGFKPYLERVMRGDKLQIIVAHRDRLARFGGEIIQFLVEQNGGEVVVLDPTVHSPAAELTDDWLAILHLFSCRMYGLRRYRNQIKKDRDLTNDRAKGDIA